MMRKVTLTATTANLANRDHKTKYFMSAAEAGAFLDAHKPSYSIETQYNLLACLNDDDHGYLLEQAPELKEAIRKSQLSPGTIYDALIYCRARSFGKDGEDGMDTYISLDLQLPVGALGHPEPQTIYVDMDNTIYYLGNFVKAERLPQEVSNLLATAASKFAEIQQPKRNALSKQDEEIAKLERLLNIKKEERAEQAAGLEGFDPRPKS